MHSQGARRTAAASGENGRLPPGINLKRLAYALPREGRRPAGAPTPLRDRVASFLDERLRSAAPATRGEPAPPSPPAPAPQAPSPPATVDFVAEDDVRRALREGRTIRLGRGAIVTPAARDFAAGKSVLIED